MRDTFFPFFKYDQGTINHIWENGIIVIDTNALLNTYKMHKDAREQFFNVLQYADLNSKLWMPYQIGWEVLKNRREAIDESLEALKSSKEGIKRGMQKLKSTVNKSGLKYHEEFLNQIQTDLDEFKQNIEDSFKGYNEENSIKRSDFYTGNELKETDPIIDRIDTAFKGKYAEQIDHTELISHYTQGEFRFSLTMAPGYEDADKGDYRKFGDFIIWEEMIKKATKCEKPIIFVTEDHKKDWWQTDPKTEKKSPLPELLKEFKGRAKQFFYMYSYKDFVEQAKVRYPDLPDAEMAAKQMNLATEEAELKEQNEYIGMPSIYDTAVKEAHYTLQQLYYQDGAKSIAYAEKLDDIFDKDISKMEMGYELLKIIDDMKKEISSYEYRN
ncbi:PIN domain-containing protein [Priestia megaterium]|uniref:PIN domain-containing protein n=1 Tax=Priestia megaterium TaxID=1404 RepID=UPI002EB37F29|nr:PIN-like domain-containing protein [Priestia megaterium]